MKVAIYLRVSTTDQETKNQTLELREFSKKQGWTIYREYCDVVSGGKGMDERLQFKEMFSDASKRKFDLLLFWSLDRLSREGVLPTLNYLSLLDSYGVSYKSFSEQYLDSSGIFRDCVISLLATLAKQERIRLKERTIAGLNRARAEGKILGRPRVTVDNNKIKQLRSEGMSYRSIAQKLGVSMGKITEAIRC